MLQPENLKIYGSNSFSTKINFRHRFDTKNIFVTIRNRFSLRGYKNKYGKSLIYLDVSNSKKRIRLNTEIEIPANCWDNKKQRIVSLENSEALNLVLANIESKLTAIKTTFMLQERILDAQTLIKEFQTETPEFDFISYLRNYRTFGLSSKNKRVGAFCFFGRQKNE
jgi:integrase/recombinase XerD